MCNRFQLVTKSFKSFVCVVVSSVLKEQTIVARKKTVKGTFKLIQGIMGSMVFEHLTFELPGYATLLIEW